LAVWWQYTSVLDKGRNTTATKQFSTDDPAATASKFLQKLLSLELFASKFIISKLDWNAHGL